MAAKLFPVAKSQFVDNDGNVLSLGTVEISYTTTANPAPTYLDAIKSAQNEHPILLTAAGKADIYLDAGSYNIVTKDSGGVVVDTTYNYIVESASAVDPGAGNVPIGGIIMYNGLLADIPVAWSLCDGIDSTPDLSGKFIMGTKLQGEIGNEGGSADAVLVAHTHPMPHTHPIDHTHAPFDSQLGGSHTHDLRLAYASCAGGDTQNPSASGALTDDFTSWALPHTHAIAIPRYTGLSGDSEMPDTGSAGDTGIGTNLPPYYTLAFIQRIA